MMRAIIIIGLLAPLFATAQFAFEKSLNDFELNGPVRSVSKLEIDGDDTTVYKTAFNKKGEILLDIESWGWTSEETEFIWDEEGFCTAYQESNEDGFTIYTFTYNKAGLVNKKDVYTKSENSDTSVTRIGSSLYVYSENMMMELEYGPRGELTGFSKSFRNEHKKDTAIYHYGADSLLNRAVRLSYDEEMREKKAMLFGRAGIFGYIEYTYGPNNSTIVQRMDAGRVVYQQMQENLNDKGLPVYYALDDELMNFSSEYSYEYEYDEQGNWIKKTSKKDNQPFQIETRSITYYK